MNISEILDLLSVFKEVNGELLVRIRTADESLLEIASISLNEAEDTVILNAEPEKTPEE